MTRMGRSGRSSHQFPVMWFGRGCVLCGMGAALRLGDPPPALGALCPLWLSCPFWRIEDGAGTSWQRHPSCLGHTGVLRDSLPSSSELLRLCALHGIHSILGRA